MLLIRRLNCCQLLVALMLALVFAHPAHAKDTPQQRAARLAITAQYVIKDQAVRDKDINAYASILAPDYVAYGMLRIPIVRERHLALQYSNFRANSNSVKTSATKIKSIEWRGPDAIVMIEVSVDADAKGLSMHWNFLTRDYWGQINGKWLLRQSADSKMWGSANGEAFSMG